MEVTVNHAKLMLIQGDITLQSTDAIVNAANSSLMGGGGVDGAIHRAGGPAIIEECKRIVDRHGRLPTGKAVITTGGNLRARHVIHTVGPIWRGGDHGEAKLLASAYLESLKIAEDSKLASVSFPSISTGAYGYPVDDAAEVALRAVLSFLGSKASTVNEVVFVLYSRSVLESYERALRQISPIALDEAAASQVFYVMSICVNEGAETWQDLTGHQRQSSSRQQISGCPPSTSFPPSSAPSGFPRSRRRHTEIPP